MNGPLKIGTRGSDLALWQADRVAAALRESGFAGELERAVIRTSGDGGTKPADPAGFKGMFTREIDAALLEGRIDLAVHSLKDVPGQLPPGLALAAVLERGPESDLLVVKRRPILAVGTSSVRRRFQVGRLFPGALVEELRGNVPTRLDKLAASGSLDAIILAEAGLARLGIRPEDRGFESVRLDTLPAAGQGIVAAVAREGDAATRELLAAFCHPPTMIRARAERELLRLLDGTCDLPVGARTRIDGDRLFLEVEIYGEMPGGVRRAAAEGSATDPEAIAAAAREQLG